ncbi:glycosyltransferase family 2 protein [Aerococcus viridans]
MKNKELPLVSVIITTYKRADFLSRAIESVLSQDYLNIEILVIDDNDPSSEFRKETSRLMERYCEDERVYYIKHNKNKNGATARNTGINHSKGFYITFLDDDDNYKSEKVSSQVNYLIGNPQYKAVYCGWIRENKIETPNIVGDLSYEILSGDLLIRTNTIMMEKSVSEKIGNWDSNYSRNQEAAYLLRFFRNGYLIGSVPKPLVEFDTSDRGNAANPKKNQENFEFFLKDQEKYMNSKFTKEEIDEIVLKRMRGVGLGYLKNHSYLGFAKLYFKMIINYPIKYNKYFICYLKDRITN